MNCLQLTFMQFFIIAQFPSHGLLRSFHSCLFLKRMHRAPFEVNDRCRRKPAVYIEQMDNYKYRILHHTGNIYIRRTCSKVVIKPQSQTSQQSRSKLLVRSETKTCLKIFWSQYIYHIRSGKPKLLKFVTTIDYVFKDISLGSAIHVTLCSTKLILNISKLFRLICLTTTNS